MHTDAHDESRRALALGHVHSFCERVLPGVVRRIAVWKRLGTGRLPDLLDELRQEIALDCLLDPDLVLRLPAAERNARWMRLAERWIYRHCVRERTAEEVHELLPAPSQGRPPDARFLPLVDVGVSLGNGRWNMTASAVRCGRRVTHLRADVELLAQDLGIDREYDAFWHARLAEAMTGLAADLLRASGRVHLLPAAHGVPDPRRRLRRMRSIARRFFVRPATIHARRLVRPWLRRPHFDADAPGRLLAGAVALAPHLPAAWLWLFEAHMLAGDHRFAMAAVRRCRSLEGAPRAALVLARARLLEARGHLARGRALLRRALMRWPVESRLRLASDA